MAARFVRSGAAASSSSPSAFVVYVISLPYIAARHNIYIYIYIWDISGGQQLKIVNTLKFRLLLVLYEKKVPKILGRYLHK